MPLLTASQSLKSSDLLPQGSAQALAAFLQEVLSFRDDCLKRYQFNNRLATFLTTMGLLLSAAVVSVGFLHHPEITAILGGLVGALVTAQRAFPFDQRASFYRLLIGQTENLVTRMQLDLLTVQHAADLFTSLRMDYAQELPRGTTSQQPSNSTPSTPAGIASPAKGLGNAVSETPPAVPADISPSTRPAILHTTGNLTPPISAPEPNPPAAEVALGTTTPAPAPQLAPLAQAPKRVTASVALSLTASQNGSTPHTQTQRPVIMLRSRPLPLAAKQNLGSANRSDQPRS